jgi:hypothetical protein
VPTVTRVHVVALFLLTQLAASPGPISRAAAMVDLAHPGRRFDPRATLGAALDGHPAGTTVRLLTPRNIRAMLGAGLGPLTYRLRTELAVEAWHWNPVGRWSDSAREQGYWTSDAAVGEPIAASFGYRLPRRGDTRDQANDDGYSRIDDGDTTTFWKSNPYLDRRLGARGALPQWLYVDLGAITHIDAARLVWGEPYARRFALEYWKAGPGVAPTDSAAGGRWLAFPGGHVGNGAGGTTELRLADTPVATRYVRIVFGESSHTAPPGASDPRDSVGFALRELFLGTVDSRGFHDRLRHGPSGDRQTTIYVSSTDPWHRAGDRDTLVEQPGLDRVFASGLTRGLPALLPVGVLYDIPENAAALLAYVRARGYVLRGIELGEEPDGQFVAPEDYASLYRLTAAALRAEDSSVVLGGPSWQDPEDLALPLWPAPPAPPLSDSWYGRFRSALERGGSPADAAPLLRFFSFEWYPFDQPCEPAAPEVRRAPDMLRRAVARLRSAGLPPDLPWLVSEYGYSVFGARQEVEIEGALVNADIVGTTLSEGGDAFLYGYEPEVPIREAPCDSWGNMMLLRADTAGQARDTLATWWGAWLETHAWLDSTGGEHRLLPVTLAGAAPLGAYAVLRPDSGWAVLLVNRDARRSIDVALRPRGDPPRTNGAAVVWQYSSAQYAWRAGGPNGRPSRSRPPLRREYPALPRQIALPPWSLTVVAVTR